MVQKSGQLPGMFSKPVVNNGINYLIQQVSLPDFWTINSINKYATLFLGGWMILVRFGLRFLGFLDAFFHLGFFFRFFAIWWESVGQPNRNSGGVFFCCFWQQLKFPRYFQLWILIHDDFCPCLFLDQMDAHRRPNLFAGWEVKFVTLTPEAVSDERCSKNLGKGTRLWPWAAACSAPYWKPKWMVLLRHAWIMAKFSDFSNSKTFAPSGKVEVGFKHFFAFPGRFLSRRTNDSPNEFPI